LKKANVEWSGTVKVTGHKNIQSLDEYDEANEDEQRQLSYAISGRNNFNPQLTVFREFPGGQLARAACLFSLIPSTAESANAIATDFDAQFISVWTKPKFHIAQSDNDESSREKCVEHFQLLPGFIQLQELQVFKTSHSKCEAY